MTNLYFVLCAFIFSTIIFIILVRKKMFGTIEEIIFRNMVVIEVLESAFASLIIYLAYKKPESNLIFLFNRIDFSLLLLWVTYFASYFFFVSFQPNNDKIKMLVKHAYIIDVVPIVLCSVLPIYVVNSNNIMYAYGPSVNIIYGVVGIAFAVIFMSVILNIKKIISKKYIPFYALIILAIAVVAIRIIDPSIVSISYGISLVNLIMYLSLENPDEKIFKIEEKMKNLAIEANKNKSNFLSNMSHELRTPLNVVVGLSEDIDSYKDMVPKDVQEDSIDIQNASNTLLEIIGNILDISKIESGKFELVPTYYDPKEEFESLSKIMRTKVAEKPIEFTVSIDPELPKVLYGDRIRIKQIINNFLSNAIKYTDRGKVDFIVKWIKESSALDIRISDTGNGIKPEDMDKLFTKFERLQVEKVSAVQGTGLGLAITKELIELMNGTVNVESEYKKGSVFKVLLPQTIGSEVELNKLKNQANYGSIQLDLTGKKVLIVDDNELNIKVLKKAIKNYNFDIDTCTDGQVALNKLSTVYYDLVFMDIRMPSMNGVTVFEEVHKMIGFRTPIIALTADAMTGSKEKYLELGFADYLAKPFSRRKLAEKIAKLFEIPTIQSNQTVIQNVNIQTNNFNNKNKEQVLEMVSNQIQQLGNQSQPIVIENVTVNITNDKQE